MRKLNGDKALWTQEAHVPLGVCKICAGEGRYRTTYKKKAPIIHHCLQCDGTGKAKLRVRRIDGTSDDWRLKGPYEFMGENEHTFTMKTSGNGFTQFDKKHYELY